MFGNYTIIVENDESQWNDNTGVFYHFPERYLKYLRTGTKIIYYKGKQKKASYSNQRLSKEPHYFGLGIIGEIVPDEKHSKNYYASILEYLPFSIPISIRDVNGKEHEKIPLSRINNYWRDGVRPINKDIYEAILTSARINLLQPLNETSEIPLSAVKATMSSKTLLKLNVSQKNTGETNSAVSAQQYYSPIAKKIGDRGEQIVYDFLKDKLPPEEAQTVRWLAQEGQTPGYDIEYHALNGDKICIEVKSTTAKSFAQFLFTSNELKAAETYKENYIIYLVSDCLGVNPLIDQLPNPFSQQQEGSLLFEPIAFKVSRVE